MLPGRLASANRFASSASSRVRTESHNLNHPNHYQDAIGKLRVSLGLDVERGGAGRCFGANDTFVVTERRRDGGREHLKLISGGWVLSRHPETQELLCHEAKHLRGGFPPRSIILNPDQARAFLFLFECGQRATLTRPACTMRIPRPLPACAF